MGLTYAQAQALGIGHLFPASSGKGNRLPLIVPPAVSRAETLAIGGKTIGDFKGNKLEWRFWQRLWAAFEAGEFFDVDAHCLRVRAIGDASWYTPDFVTRPHHGPPRWIWETKGHLREKDKLRLIGAAARYPEWRWVIVFEEKRKWQCHDVSARGISREVWCPGWLN